MDMSRLLNQTTASKDKRARESSSSSGEGDKGSSSGGGPEAKKPRTKDFASGQGLEPKGKDKEVARTGSPEGSQEQERDDTALVLDNIGIDTLKSVYNAIRSMVSSGKDGKNAGLYAGNHPYHDTALSLMRDATKARQFREEKKGASRDDAYAAMGRLLTEVPRMPTASTNITKFLRKVEQIKQNNPEQAEEGAGGS